MGSNPLSPLVYKVNAAVGVIAIAATAINIILLFVIKPAEFQSLGTVWISTAILMFAGWRFVSQQILAGFKGQGSAASEVNSLLDAVAIRDGKGWRNYISADGRPVENPPTYTEEEIEQFVSEATASIDGRIFGPEIGLLVIGTLQTGYGEKLSCWVNGGGVSLC